MSDSNFINEVKTELQKAVGGGKTALAEVNALKPRVAALEGLKPKAHLVETWRSGASWYRKWSDGFIEQGGYKAATTNDYQKATIAFHVSFASTNVGVQITIKSSYDGTAQVKASSASEITTTKFVTYPQTSRVSPGIFWVAYGY